MKALRIESTEDTPEIILDDNAGEFGISGRSLPEEVISFYSPVLDWIERYSKDPLDKTVVKLKMDYINSASQRALLEVLNYFQRVKETGNELEIEWYYIEDDDEMLEAGEEYMDILELPFNFISYVPE